MRKAAQIILQMLLLSLCMLHSCTEKQERSDSKELIFGCFLNSPKHQQELQNLLQEFSRKEGIPVRMIGLNWADGKTKLISAFNSGTEPDIVELGSDWVAQFSGSNILAELSPQQIHASRFAEYSLQPAIWDKKLYAVPWVLSTRILFCNEDLEQKAGILPQDYPQDLKQLTQCAARIHQYAAGQGIYGVGIISHDPHQVYKRVLPLMWSNDGDILNPAGQSILNSPQNQLVLEEYCRLASYGIIESARQLDKMFLQGRLGYWISGPWLLEKIPKENPGLRFRAALIPGYKKGNGLSFAGGDYLAISKNCKNKKEALKLIMYLTNAQNTMRLCKLSITAGIPADTNAMHDPFFQSIKGFPAFVEQLRYSRLTAVHPRWLDIESAFEMAVSQAVYKRKSPHESLQDADAEIRAILNK
jgi:multiple sugar transport system substrate-binding protein